MNIFWSKALLSTQHSVKLVSYKKGLDLVMVPANFVVEKKFPNMFFVLRCCCCCYCSGENSTKFLTKKNSESEQKQKVLSNRRPTYDVTRQSFDENDDDEDDVVEATFSVENIFSSSSKDVVTSLH